MIEHRNGWLAGSSSRTFPVATGTPMAGYMARSGPALGIHDELSVGALALLSAGKRVVLVSADVAAVDAELVDEVASAAGLHRSELVIFASHTHSGPAGVVARLHPAEADQSAPALRAGFVATCADAIRDSLGRLEPVELLFGGAETAGLAANRNDPHGPYDPRVSVIATRRPSGDLQAVLIHFACHPTVLGAENRLISADFPGALRSSLRTRLGRDGHSPEVFFANGAAGDVSTRYTRQGQDFAEVDRLGDELAAAALAALGNVQTISGPILHERQAVRLETRPLDARGDSGIASTGHPGEGDDAERRKSETRAQGTALLERLREVGVNSVRTTFDLDVWALGELALIAVPGELFASLGARIAACAPPALILGYANGYVGYLVDEAAHVNGTYEALASPFALGAGEHVAETGCVLMRRLRMAGET